MAKSTVLHCPWAGWAMLGVLVVALSGCARFVAQSTGTAPLGTNAGVRTLGQVLNDNAIERTAKINMYKLDSRFQYARIQIHSFHSAVLLTGQVKDQYLKQLAEDNVKAMSDVKAVHNYIAIGEKIPYNSIVQDGIITATIRRLLLTSAEVSDTKVKVQTEDGVVYVMGKLTPGENRALIELVQQVPHVVKVVSLIDLLSNDLGPTAGGNPGVYNAQQAAINQPMQPGAPAKNSSTASVETTPLAIDPEHAAPEQPASVRIP